MENRRRINIRIMEKDARILWQLLSMLTSEKIEELYEGVQSDFEEHGWNDDFVKYYGDFRQGNAEVFINDLIEKLELYFYPSTDIAIDLTEDYL